MEKRGEFIMGGFGSEKIQVVRKIPRSHVWLVQPPMPDILFRKI